MTQNEAYGELASGIIEQAIKDWKDLCKHLGKSPIPPKRDMAKVTFDSLRMFFKGEWCYSLCVGYDPLVILAGLERELRETEKQIKLQEVVNG